MHGETVKLLLNGLFTAFPFATLGVHHRQQFVINPHIPLRNQIIRFLCIHHISVGSTPARVQLGSPFYDRAGEVAALSRRALLSALHSHCATLLQPVSVECAFLRGLPHVFCSRLQTCVGFVQTITLCGLSYVTTGMCMDFKCCHGSNLVRSADLHCVNKLCILFAVKRVTSIYTQNPRNSWQGSKHASQLRRSRSRMIAALCAAFTVLCFASVVSRCSNSQPRKWTFDAFFKVLIYGI